MPWCRLGIGSSHFPVVLSKVGEAGSYRYSTWSNTVDLFCQLGSRVLLLSNEAFLHVPARSVPEGWRVYAYEVYVSKR